jgi:hypothetical protein
MRRPYSASSSEFTLIHEVHRESAFYKPFEFKKVDAHPHLAVAVAEELPPSTATDETRSNERGRDALIQGAELEQHRPEISGDAQEELPSAVRGKVWHGKCTVGISDGSWRNPEKQTADVLFRL